MNTPSEADRTTSSGPDVATSLLPNGASRSWEASSSNFCGVLILDRAEASVGESVQVEWLIDSVGEGSGPPSERDWIGLFPAGRHFVFTKNTRVILSGLSEDAEGPLEAYQKRT